MTKNKIKYLVALSFMILAMLVPNIKVFANALTVEPVQVATSDDPLEDELQGDLEGEGDGEQTEPNPNETTFEGFEISEDVMLDKYLYSALLNIYKATDPNYSGSVIYSDMFKNFEEINLDKKNISSLSGFDKLELDNLISFSANLNNLTELDKTFFQNIDEDKFTSLSLAGNSISQIDLTNFDNLTYLDLSSNKLSKIDMSVIEGRVQNTRININLANNKFKSIKNIVLPNKRIGHIELNIINNNITDITDSYFTDFFTMYMGIQGFLDNEKTINVDTATNLIVYPFNIEGLAVEIYKTDGEADELVATISDSNVVTEYAVENLTVGKRLMLPVGEYEYIYTLNGESAFSRNDYTRLYLDSCEFGVIPQKVNYKFTFKGKDYEELGKVTGKVTVTLSSSEEGAEIYYQINGSEWKKGTVVECDKGGSYSINVKAVIGGVESEVQSIWVRTSLNLYVSDWVMLVMVTLLTLVLFLVVLPIISKKYFKKD